MKSFNNEKKNKIMNGQSEKDFSMDYANPFKFNMIFYDILKTFGHKILKVDII